MLDVGDAWPPSFTQSITYLKSISSFLLVIDGNVVEILHVYDRKCGQVLASLELYLDLSRI